MIARAPDPVERATSAIVIVDRPGDRLARLRHRQRRVGRRPRARLRDRAGANRKPYYDDEELEGRGSSGCSSLGVLAARRHRRSPAALLGARAEPPGRRHRGDSTTRFVELGCASCSRRPAEGGFNCAGCHGGMKATGGVAPYTITDPATGEVEAVNWKAPALNTVLYRFSDDEVQLHPHLRPSVLADVAVGPRRRRPDERPADRHAHRLPRGRSS